MYGNIIYLYQFELNKPKRVINRLNSNVFADEGRVGREIKGIFWSCGDDMFVLKSSPSPLSLKNFKTHIAF